MGKKWIILLGIIATLVLGSRVYYHLTDDFRLSNITHDMPYRPEWKTATGDPAEEKMLQSILAQPFRYLGKGAQSYVFASDDGLYVLKFFKFKHLRPDSYMNFVPDIGPLATYKAKQAARKERKLIGVFTSHILAYHRERDESGLVFLQMNSQGNPSRMVVLYDKLGQERTLDLKKYPFVLQRRGIPLDKTLDSLLGKGNVSEAKDRIDQIFSLYAQEYSQGIYDHDHGVDRNTGFLGNAPAHLDVGKLLVNESMKNPEVARSDALLVGEKLKEWIHKNYKMYYRTLSKHIDKAIDTYIAPAKDAKVSP